MWAHLDSLGDCASLSKKLLTLHCLAHYRWQNRKRGERDKRGRERERVRERERERERKRILKKLDSAMFTDLRPKLT